MAINKVVAMELNSLNSIISVHPGEVLQSELVERGIKQKDFAPTIGMEPSHLSALIHGNRNITPAIANRLEQALDIPATVWMNLQSRYNLDQNRQTSGLGLSALVDGYRPTTRPSAVLREASPLEEGESQIVLGVPNEEVPFAKELFNRLGWKVE